MDPFQKLFCVRVNNAPEIGVYFTANNTIPSNEEIVALNGNNKNIGFRKTMEMTKK